MQSEMIIIRPPSEANSLLLPLTIGCSHNACTFCDTYNDIKFRIRHTEDIIHDIDRVAQNYSRSVRRIFLENGDALICPQHMLVDILKHLYKSFPALERVGTYASPKSVLIKSDAELKELNELGLKIAYLGVETGDEELLEKVNKGVTCNQMVEAGKRLKESGIITSVTVILGLGGVQDSENHAVRTGRILSEIDPDYTGALTLTIAPGTPLYQDWKEGNFSPISPFQSLLELKLIIQNSDFTRCFFASNHASNYLPIKVWLPEQKAKVIELLEGVIASKDASLLRPEFMRAL